MKRFLRWCSALILLAFAIVIVAAIAARFSDGPLGIFAGGPLESGQRMDRSLENWDVYRGTQTVDLQLEQPPRSRTVWILVDEQNLYIPAGFIKSVPFWKQWPHEALEDGRALVRIDGKIYPVLLVREDDPALRLRLFKKLSAKYDLPSPDANPDPEDTWVFRAAPRQAS